MTGLTDPDAMLDYYLKLGPKVVVLKMGEAGAYLATSEARVKIPAFPVRSVDATGAGDTFCGAFLARILAGDTPEPAARYAAVAAALKCAPAMARACGADPDWPERVFGGNACACSASEDNRSGRFLTPCKPNCSRNQPPLTGPRNQHPLASVFAGADACARNRAARTTPSRSD